MTNPAFQFYPKDYLSSARVAMMSLEEEGAYNRAMFYCWLHGSIPADPEQLARLIGKGASTTLATTVQKMFEIDANDDTKMIHPRLENEREKQKEWKEKSIAGGKKSAKVRKLKKLETMKGGSKMVATNRQPKANSSSSSPSSNNTAITSVIAVGDKAKKARGSRLPEVYELTDEMIDYAKASAPDISVALEHEKFCNYWHAKSGRDATKIDWAATWRNWMLNAQQWAGSKKEHTNGTNKRAGNEAVLDDAARYYQEWERTGVQPPN